MNGQLEAQSELSVKCGKELAAPFRSGESPSLEKEFFKIVLPAKASDDLKWEVERQQALNVEKITWEFDLGLTQSLDDEMQFQACVLALETFARTLYSEKTERIVLYRGQINLSTKESFAEWKQQRPPAREEHLRRLFAADAYAYYFQMLAHRLPDEVPLVLAFSEEGCGTRAEREQLLSRERFEHFILERNIVTEAPVAVCFPEEAKCSGEILQKMDALFEQLKEPFRVIGEPFLIEEWHGVDVLYVLAEALSPRGERMLKGFEAAGGTALKI